MSDQDRFLAELDTNFSVQAAAGTGKTYSLVNRIARIAAERPATLGKLVVVTYTHRAADEMRQRLRDALLKMAPSADGLLWQGLSRIFIGTIHGFCLRLIGEYGLWLGYGAPATAAAEDDPELRRDFERSQGNDRRPVPPWLARVHRAVPARDIAALAAVLGRRTVDWSAVAARSRSDWGPALAALRVDPAALAEVRNNRSPEAVARWQGRWKEFAGRWNDPASGFVPVPAYDGTGGAVLVEAWGEHFARWADPLLKAAVRAAVEEAAAFQEYRLRTGRLLFGDQIVLAHRLAGHPEVRERLLAEGFHVLLDEAQDTDPLQFELLAELARPPGSVPFAWPRDPAAEGPGPGRFIMVGDAQQAIYRDRATVGVYRRYDAALEAQPWGASLTFAKTYRCRPGVAAFVNHRFANVLTGSGGQVAFVPLVSGTADSAGEVVRWVRPKIIGSNAQRMGQETRWLARRLKELGPSGLRARSWDEVAILCPAREWLHRLHRALGEAGVPALLHFDRPQFQQPAYLWLTALLTLHVEPNNGFEVAGALRELYGIDDDAIYRFRHANGTADPVPLRLGLHPGADNEIARLLDLWQRCRTEAEALPLADAAALWVERTGLRARLAALPSPEAGRRSLRALDRLLLRAHAAQREGRSLRDFHRELLLGVERPGADHDGPQEPRVQLMTMKKAKGLQWDAVVLPFLGHGNVSGGKGDYPMVFSPVGLGAGAAEEGDGLPVEVALRKAFHSAAFPDLKEADEEEDLRERNRLFYVACTRARHTLVLVDDARVWEKELKKGGTSLPRPNGYEALRGPAEGDPATFVNPLDLSVEKLVAEPTASPLLGEGEEREGIPVEPWPEEVALDPVPLRGKRLPSRHEESEALSLGKDTEATVLRAQSLLPRRAWIELGANDALAYGLWWHNVLRRWPWTGDTAARKAFLAAALEELAIGPVRDRAAAEIARFAASETCRRLAALPAAKRLQEIPYTRPLGETAVEDGQIDLLYDGDGGEWTLLDWKTDLPPADGDRAAYEERLRGRYAAQLHAYRDAVAAFGFPVTKCRIYSTALGIDLAV